MARRGWAAKDATYDVIPAPGHETIFAPQQITNGATAKAPWTPFAGKSSQAPADGSLQEGFGGGEI